MLGVRFNALGGCLMAGAIAVGCSGSDSGGTGSQGGSAGEAGAAVGGSAGSSVGGSTASGGSSAVGGSSGSTAQGGTGGTAGSGGVGGDGGTSGVAGDGGTAGSTAGAGGVSTGGSAGSAGAVTGGAGGSTAGGAGGGLGGSAGSAGAPDASAGTGGEQDGGGGTGAVDASTGGMSGAGGASDAGGDADAGPECVDNIDCDNGSICDGVEVCNAGTCEAGVPVVCVDDGYSCTAEFCDEATGGCRLVAQDSACGNGQFCDGVERCNPTGTNPDAAGCVAGTPIACASDGFDCTIEACNETTDRCESTPSPTFCADALHCNGIETCNPTGQGADADGCVAGVDVDCDDGVGCTVDDCNETTDSCDNTPDGALCQNGFFCDGIETCDAVNDCQPGAAVSCPDTDGVACTVEFCDEAQMGACDVRLDNTLCTSPSAPICTSGGCVGQTCPGGTDAECDDGNACNGSETCDTSTNPGVCQAGTPVGCDDGVECTLDSCDPSTGACTNTPVHNLCANLSFCDGAEMCDPGDPNADFFGCTPGTPPDCDDSVNCTFDGCSESSGCFNSPSSTFCSDGVVCNGAEQCAPGDSSADADGCISGTPVVCQDDGIACTTEACDETAGGCVATPDNTVCDCGETCDPAQGGCGFFCNVTECQTHVYECGDCIDNDGDCKIDSGIDPECFGVCDNNEEGFKGEIPGQNNAPCKMECYFDQDTGEGNDDCFWNHRCDPLSVAPDYDPTGNRLCEFNLSANIPGTDLSCEEVFEVAGGPTLYPPCATPGQPGCIGPPSPGPGQSCNAATLPDGGVGSCAPDSCLGYCGPLTPNGCDCFGCCEIPGLAYTVYLGSEDSGGNGTCTTATLTDPDLCKPCTQVPSCANPCETCEICIGKTTLPPGCNGPSCPVGQQQCGAGFPLCPEDEFCLTGCCTSEPD